MRICPDCLRSTTRLTACFSAVILAILCGTAWAATENVWQGASGGAWATGANWSLGHAPTASECAVLPDTGADYAISVSGTHLIGALQVAARAGDGVKSVTLGGSGLISNETSVAAHRIGAQVRIEERSGSWRRHMGSMPDQRATGRVFEITVPHGVKPSAASCAWRVRPCALSVP